MSAYVYLKEVVSLELDQEKCIGCGMCLEVCPHAVFGLEAKKASLDRRDACMECGACALNCPVEAIAVNANVGCARAVINAMLGRQSSACCCVIDSEQENNLKSGSSGTGSGCC